MAKPKPIMRRLDAFLVANDSTIAGNTRLRLIKVTIVHVTLLVLLLSLERSLIKQRKRVDEQSKPDEFFESLEKSHHQ